MQALGPEAEKDLRLYFTGGATAVLFGWRTSTVDIDLKLEPDSDRVLRALPRLKESLEVNIELADSPTFRRRWLQEKQWDLVQIQWDADLDPDETLYPELHSGEAWNAGRWVNADFDKMVEGARSEADFKKRKKFYEEAVRLIIEDAPVAILLHMNEQKVFHKYVHGFQMIPAGLTDMHRVWLDKA